MSQFIIYHNAKCSKSRQTLTLLTKQGIKPIIIEYLKQPPTVDTLKDILIKLKIKANELIRQKETEYNSLNLQGRSDLELLEAMANHPKLIERPIVVFGEQAIIGRPPENVLRLIAHV